MALSVLATTGLCHVSQFVKRGDAVLGRLPRHTGAKVVSGGYSLVPELRPTSAELRRRVVNTIERESLIPPGGRVLVALSGGGDSVALAALLCDVASTASWSVVGFLHVNHQLRAGANGDETFCRKLARAFDVPLLVEHADVGECARVEKVSIEEAGHRLRYAAFARAVTSGRADRVATAHTLNDLAETVLLRLIRGAGPGGLAGIRPRMGTVIRPLLGVARADLRNVLRDRGLAYREDETNHDLQVTRNRVRHMLLPFLAEHFSPGIVEALAREAAIARADTDWMEPVVNDAVSRLVVYRDGGVDVDAQVLAGEPIGLARRVVKHVLEQVGRRSVGFDHIDRFMRLLHPTTATGVEADFPGSHLSWNGTMIRLTGARGRHKEVATPRFEYLLPVPGAVAVAEAGEVLSATPSDCPAALSARARTVAVRIQGLQAPLTVRNWRPGDMIRPLGLGGHKKLQDLFVDRKIAREQRGLIPIVADSTGKILWVVGQTVGEDFRVTDGDRGVLILKATKLGGFG